MDCLTLNNLSNNEKFLPCVGYEGLYEVGNFGTIRSVDKPVFNKVGDFRYIKKGIVLKKEHVKFGYLRVVLSSNGEVKKFLVHRLVAMAFIPNPEDKPTVNHKDGDKQNNCVENLEWNTYSENNQHKYTDLNLLENQFSHSKDFRKTVASEYVYRSKTCGAVALASKYGVGRQTIYNWVKEFKG